MPKELYALLVIMIKIDIETAPKTASYQNNNNNRGA